MFHHITKDAEFEGATLIYADGTTQAVASDHPNYQEIVKLLLKGGTPEAKFKELAAPFDSVLGSLTRLSERVARKGNSLTFDGDVVTGALADHIVKLLNENGTDEKAWKGWVAFMEKAYQNPTVASREALFGFVQEHGLTILPDGDVLGYKSVRNDLRSQHSGPGIVTDAKGNVTEYANDHLPNEKGSVVEIPRAIVDTNRGVDCSVGLHIGSHDYASTFSQKLIHVSFNPRDVVSVPSNDLTWKIRVSRYLVVDTEPKRDPVNVAVFKAPVPKAPVAKPATKAAPAAAGVKPLDEEKIAYFQTVIKGLRKADPKIKLNVFKSKRVTAGQRHNFAEAAKRLGFEA